MVAAPLLSPLHKISVCEEVAFNIVGSVILIDCVIMQPLESVTETEYDPACKFATEAVIVIAESFHK